MQLAGNVALITGGAGGLGEATVRHLHGHGMKVAVFDKDGDRAKALAVDLGEGATWADGDTLSDADTEAAIAAASELGELRALVACAGGAPASVRTLGRDGSPHPWDLFEQIIGMNLMGTFNTVRHVAAAMATLDPLDEDGQRGAIVTTASVAGYEGQIGQVAYASAKAGIIGMTIVAARDLAVSGIRVNSVAPGTIMTRGWDGASAEMRETFENKVPFPKRFGRPEEFAALVEHLLANDYMNGHVARLDGAIRFDPK